MESTELLRPMRLKILYTFDKDNKTTCLARSNSPIDIRVIYIDEKIPPIGIVSLKTCCLAIASSSPELLSCTDQDYAVYTVDYSELDSPLTGHGMLSWILSSSNEENLLIAGRVCSNMIFPSSSTTSSVKETLQVKLQLRPVANSTQSMYIEKIKLYTSLSQHIPSSFDPSKWLAFLKSNPSIMAQINNDDDNIRQNNRYLYEQSPMSPYISSTTEGSTPPLPSGGYQQYPASSPPRSTTTRSISSSIPPPSSKNEPHAFKRQQLTNSLDLELPPSSNDRDSAKRLPGPPKKSDKSSPEKEDSNKRTTSCVRRHSLQKKRIETQLLNAINEGRVPPYCENCGAIKTSVWRRVKSKKRNNDNNNNIKTTKNQSDMLLCNPCGLYYGTKNRMRPPSCWGKDSKLISSSNNNNVISLPDDEIIALGVSKSLTTRDNHHTKSIERVKIQQQQPLRVVLQDNNNNNNIVKASTNNNKNKSIDKENIIPSPNDEQQGERLSLSKTGSPTDNDDEEEDDINSLFQTPRKLKKQKIDLINESSPSPWVKRLFSLPNSSSPTTVSRGLDCVLEDIRICNSSPPATSSSLFSLHSDQQDDDDDNHNHNNNNHSDLWSELATSPIAYHHTKSSSSSSFVNTGLDLAEYLNSIQDAKLSSSPCTK